METSLEIPVRSKQIGLENHCLTSFLSQCFIRRSPCERYLKEKQHSTQMFMKRLRKTVSKTETSHAGRQTKKTFQGKLLDLHDTLQGLILIAKAFPAICCSPGMCLR